MQTVQDYLRLGVRGLLLDVAVYRQQREAPDALKRGMLLVMLIGLLVAVAALVGSLVESLASPPAEQVNQTIYEGLTTMPWYQETAEDVPGFEEEFRTQFDQTTDIIATLQGGIGSSAAGIGLIPLAMLLGWLISGTFAHLVARMLDGRGTLNQTLGYTALAAGANLLGIVQIVPFAQVSGVALLSLLATYIAVREAHALQPWRAFLATLLGPLLLVLVFVGLLCVLVAIAPGAVGGGVS
jgi:hypothetical protein